MMTRRTTDSRNCFEIVSIEDLVPKDHLVRKVDKALDFDFIYPLVESMYSSQGRPVLIHIILFKMVFIQYLFGIRSMRQTIKEIETNMAYRWFLGLEISEKVPHFSTFGKNYVRRFKDTDVFYQIFLLFSMKLMLRDSSMTKSFLLTLHISKRMLINIRENESKWNKKQKFTRKT